MTITYYYNSYYRDFHFCFVYPQYNLLSFKSDLFSSLFVLIFNLCRA